MPVVGGTSVVVGVLGGARGAGVLVARAAGWLVSTSARTRGTTA